MSLSNQSQRHYPNGMLAAHVLGAVDFEEKGNAGIEKGLDAELRGTPGHIRLLTDVHRRGIAPQTTIPAKPGASLKTAIKRRSSRLSPTQRWRQPSPKRPTRKAG